MNKPGTDGFFTIIHEIGHALGLEHPHETSDGDQIVGFKDNYEYTIMSYNESKLNPGVFPRTPQILDVAAIQYLYGVNNNTRSGDDIYSWEDNENFMQTIWDTGGNDTISAAKQSNEVTIDLAAGYANIGLNNKTYKPARSNLQIPVNVIIENIKGGQGDDTLIGNNIDNRLEGNGGNDTLEGNGGNDFIDGGEGEDTAIFSDAPQNYDYEVIDNNQIKIIHARGSESVQTDILINIENLNFLDTNLTVHTLTAQKFYQATNQQGKVADLLKHNSGSIFQQIIDFLVTYLVRLMVHLAVLIVVLVH
ncbi:M10 family metallopeptidase [Crocosphaera sp.]|uniref:M10 family metallopeptidase n=1 Tax=Crocosphaera sp. TaxID=2729996 RepID=UPI00257FC254|nr:M10 family metallopeptidase [Crocosphaera sp.]